MPPRRSRPPPPGGTVDVSKRVTAVVLAAGESRRMGRPKQLLSWGETTILGRTLHNLQQSDVDDILVVSGHRAEEVAAIAHERGVRTVHNPDYAEGEMLSSLQAALPHLPRKADAVLVMLADQPLVDAPLINAILDAYRDGAADLVAPAYRGRRGNPVLIGRRYFDELATLPWGDAPRTLLRRHAAALHLVPVDSEAILLDIDRPQEYRRRRPGTPASAEDPTDGVDDERA